MSIPDFFAAPRPIAIAVTATAASLWLLLPRGRESRAARWLGVLLGIVSLAAFAFVGRRLGNLGEEGVFLTVSLVAIVAGAATVLTRSPVYSAIWFALALAGVAGVMLVLGAQFLGVATVVVYAGAILVMFLFVLMLAQPSGMAAYDRTSNEPFLSAVAASILLGLLALSIDRLPIDGRSAAADIPAASAAADIPAASAADCATGSGHDPLAKDHVARLGAELFGRHLVSVEAAGVLLLVALVGAIAVVSRGEAAGEREGSR